ncbi:MAG: hypothetical protein EZS28_054019 [Streblomastix strix]|uniref:Uncharacterized protein n=1 Tax=Streblomastix strix TaxID=222440 RepID=A0A5J4QYS6_9EUKA|nr:MAG: hypothetical protein EZS28_054019 [Streblomastix strix]
MCYADYMTEREFIRLCEGTKEKKKSNKKYISSKKEDQSMSNSESEKEQIEDGDEKLSFQRLSAELATLNIPKKRTRDELEE